ncbi:MAG TPA: T9SS type A sorting domain-containing protein, partial [Bacteroidia bacterium]|nr:T9SS type A sorting domain-containing protein [Bacteroidia bacterium]
LTSLHVDNHTLRACGALGMSAVVLNDVTSTSADGQPNKWIQTALWNIDNVLWRSNVRQSDPGQIAGYSEGPHYLRFGMRHCLEFFHAMGNFAPDATFSVSFDGSTRNVRHPFYDPNFELLWEWVMRIRMPDGRDPQIEDSFAQTFNADMTLTGQSRFRPTYHGSRFNPAAPTTLEDQLHHSSDDIVADFISAMTPPTTDTFPLLQVLPQSGDIVMRSGWDTTSTYLHIAAKNGRTRSSANGHNHVDVTGFILHARGQELAIDPGYLKWDRRDEVDGPSHHNMILVNGAGPTEATTGVAGDADGFAGGEFDFKNMDYAEVSTTYQGAGIVRKPLFVRSDYFLIADEVTAASPNSYQFQLHALGLEGGDSTHGSFVLDSIGSGGTWSKNGVNLRAVVTANGGLTSLGRATQIHELRYDSMETHTVLHANKNAVSNANFLAALIPYENDSPDVALLCGLGCDAIRVRRGGFVDVASLRASVPASETGLAQDLTANAQMAFYSESSTGEFSQFLIENGTLLKYGADTLGYATQAANWALGKMDSTIYEAYAGATATYYVYHLGFVPGSVLGFGTVQSWQYDLGLDRLEIVIGTPGRFTIHKDVIIGGESGAGEKVLTIWPNPGNGHVQVRTLAQNGTLEVMALDGRQVFAQVFAQSTFDLDLHGLPLGIYLIRVKDAEGNVIGVEKLVLEN